MGVLLQWTVYIVLYMQYVTQKFTKRYKINMLKF